MFDYAVLRDGEVIPVEDVLEWARWFEMTDHRVAFTKTDHSEISTVFLGSNHAFGGGLPKWFETLVFGGTLDQEMARYTTLEQAMRGHEQMVARVKEAESGTEAAE